MSAKTDKELLRAFEELLREFFDGQQSLMDDLGFMMALATGDVDKIIKAAGENTTTGYAKKFLALAKEAYGVKS